MKKRKQACDVCGAYDCTGSLPGDPVHPYRGAGSWNLGCHCEGCTLARNESGGFLGALADALAPKRAPGRPTDKPLTASIKARVSADEHATYMALGGSAWLRKQIELHQDEVKHGSR